MTARAVSLLLALCLATRVGAQATTQGDTAKGAANGWMSGFALGVPGTSQAIPALFTAGWSFTEVHPNRVGADVSVGTMPYVMSWGLLPIGLRLGVATPLTVAPHVLLIPSAGMSLIGAAGPGGAGGLAGLNAGASSVFYIQQIGLKTGITLHAFAGANEPVWLFEVGFVSLPAGLP